MNIFLYQENETVLSTPNRGPEMVNFQSVNASMGRIKQGNDG